MKKILLGLLMFCSFVPSLFAAPVAPSNIHVISNTSNSITFEWDEVSGALGYYLYWGVSSVNENEEITPIEGTQFTLDTLESNMDYKIALTTVDSSGEESALSSVQTFSTASNGIASASQDFQLLEVKTLDENTLQFSFNNTLENSENAQREFLIMSSVAGQELSISGTDLDVTNPKNLKVSLNDSLTPSTSYDVTVLAIKDSEGKTIENGIDAVTNFTTPLSFEIEEVDMNSAGDPEEDTPVIEETPAEEVQTPVQTGGPGGQIMDPQETEKHTIVAAKQNDNLPQTGPEHIILLLLSLLGVGIYFFFLRKQKTF